MTVALAAEIERSFGVDVDLLRPLDVVAHNMHYSFDSHDGPLHVTLYDLVEGSAEVEELEEVHRIVSRLDGPTAWLAATLRSGVSGRLLEPTGLGHVSLRRHARAETGRDLDAAVLTRVALDHAEMLAASVATEAGLRDGGLRFLTPRETLDAVDSAMDDRLAGWMSEEESHEFRAAVAAVRRGPVAAEEDLAPVHGDLDWSNLLVIDDRVQVIDHDCMHWDQPLYDLAHLLLSICCGGYFVGPLHTERTSDMIRAVETLGTVNVDLLIEVCCYVVLEKLASVDRSSRVLAERRLSVIRDLRTLGC